MPLAVNISIRSLDFTLRAAPITEQGTGLTPSTRSNRAGPQKPHLRSPALDRRARRDFVAVAGKRFRRARRYRIHEVYSHRFCYLRREGIKPEATMRASA